MEIKVIKTGLKEIQALRVLFLHENNFQFVHDKCHLYGWADIYVLRLNDNKIGYGSVWGRSKRQDRDAIFEFYILPPYRRFMEGSFAELVSVCGAAFIECQSNDVLLSAMLYEFAQNINAEAILFKDRFQTSLSDPRVKLEKNISGEPTSDYDRQYVLKQDDEAVATGGLMLNYNMPYADIYYEVVEKHRRKGFGSMMVQELKKEAYLIDRVPSARCNINNKISKAALLKAGFEVCGFILSGEIKR